MLRMLTRSLGSEDQRDDQPIKGQCLPEDQNQNHAHEDLVLLRICSYTRVSHDTDRQPCRLTRLIFTRELNPQHSPEARWAYPDLAW